MSRGDPLLTTLGPGPFRLCVSRATVDPRTPLIFTHSVLNQPPAMGDVDLWEADPILETGVERHGAGWASDHLASFGRQAGTEETHELARDANRNEPELRTHDQYGHRIDRVDFHPAWHTLMARAVEAGVHSLGWTEDRAGSQTARTALMYLDSQ